MKLHISISALKMFLIVLLTITMEACMFRGPVLMGTDVEPPAWAPYYENSANVRYYYLPDIEVYYDVWNRQFIYLEGGNWIFVSALSPIYSGYDLNRCHVIVLDRRVHEPWHAHQYYIYHYPKYYYNSIHRERPNSRGFNENVRKPIYDNVPHPRVFPENITPRMQSPRINSPRQPEPAIYKGRTIGQPVKKFINRPRR